jgi:hypothetical protein
MIKKSLAFTKVIDFCLFGRKINLNYCNCLLLIQQKKPAALFTTIAKMSKWRQVLKIETTVGPVYLSFHLLF